MAAAPSRAHRGDRIDSELAVATHQITQELLTLNRQQLEILNELHALRAEVKEATSP